MILCVRKQEKNGVWRLPVNIYVDSQVSAGYSWSYDTSVETIGALKNKLPKSRCEDRYQSCVCQGIVAFTGMENRQISFHMLK